MKILRFILKLNINYRFIISVVNKSSILEFSKISNDRLLD